MSSSCDAATVGALKSTTETSSSNPHLCVVLFYKYFTNEQLLLFNKSQQQQQQLQLQLQLQLQRVESFLEKTCCELNLKGRILLAAEGINGTLSAQNRTVMEAFTLALQSYNHHHHNVDSVNNTSNIFHGIDWKYSTVEKDVARTYQEPFPDLKISIVKEIVSTGGAIQVSELSQYGGTHLSPQEFHETLKEAWGSWEEEEEEEEHDTKLDDTKDLELNGCSKTNNKRKRRRKEVVVIDVRNTFEHAIGHFRHEEGTHTRTRIDDKDDAENDNDNDNCKSSHHVAINPQMVAFSSFDTSFCAKEAEYLRDKKVLMYCTGGIRCEKASAMLKKRGVEDVSQLSGGIHRYIEQYGSSGFFKGQNFVFDQRVALDPAAVAIDVAVTTSKDKGTTKFNNGGESSNYVVGKCVECAEPFDEISGSRICSVCRDLVLVCPLCQKIKREYHCNRHSSWKNCYFTYLEVFNEDELKLQIPELVALRMKSKQKNIRRTLQKQIEKVEHRIHLLHCGKEFTNKNAPRRCRTCAKSESECNFLCWGFWKTPTSSGKGI